eukprot:GFUD01042514.1.p1 GENE.GFUD01042514.1~~GFUD01042514.1.p1  ORF type:complete len:1002 (-),score=358.73 GFUD01042514.1:84-3089(-)
MADAIVSLLDSDEDTVKEAKHKRKVVTVWQCVNMECKSGQSKEQMETADQYCMSFYGVEVKEGRKRKVCQHCKEVVMTKQKDLVEKLMKGESLLGEKLPVAQDILMLEDSDEELQTDSSEDEELELELTDSEGEEMTVEERLERAVSRALDKFNFDFQLSAATEELGKRLDSMTDEFADTEKMFCDLEENVDSLRREIYRDHESVIRELPPLDIKEEEEEELSALPPAGPVERPTPKHGQGVLATTKGLEEEWSEAIVELVSGDKFSVKLRDGKVKKVCGKEVAYDTAHNVRLPVGTRCVAFCRDKEQVGVFRSGVVAEPPKILNKNRYLVFLDDGYPAYVAHMDLRVVVQSSPDVWEDVISTSREFIHQYLVQYPERPMVRLSPGQTVKTECEGKWWITKVVEVDASLVLLMFDKDRRTEWLYRGSTRLGPLFSEMEQRKARMVEGEQVMARGRRVLGKKTGPVIEYRREAETDISEGVSKVSSASTGKAVAKKSTASRKTDSSCTTQWETEGTVSQLPWTAKEKGNISSHNCSPDCVSSKQYQYQEEEHRGSNPLHIPLLVGWDRQITKHANGGRRRVFYVAPCGRRLRSLEEIHKYISLTRLLLEMDFFNFDWWLHVLNEFKPSREFCSIKDLSYGKEAVPISCVNSIDRNYPEYVEYSTVRLPQKNVNLNTKEQFLTGCDCKDDCIDKKKCSCRQLTIQSTQCDWENVVDTMVGYEFRRLKEIVLTGIYECNSLCNCAKTCLNRVAQNPLRLKLQVFKTAKRGWGIRTLNDIPGGTYICVYVGNLFCTEEGNKHGKDFGDEYFADLDMIEIVESRKEGYESEASDEGFTDDPTSDMSTSEYDPTEDKDVMGQLDGADADLENGGREEKSSRRAASSKRGGLAPSDGVSGPQKEKEKQVKFVSTRKLFGAEEESYLMDAKTIGNIGRYLNHSCNPNVFVQNVFVDTHDLRFPWVAFFTSTFVRAGQELCWDYGYEVGSIADKEIFCSCGAENCRGRLL